ncbi:hypothetical protein QUF74_18130 [Candidatus Halobeggiatoa sp. HSG11]|nr:hypothetical protein [Candidatus Halobeggiatoa sp. HSG11]
MQQNFTVTCAIPRTGRTFENFLAKLKLLGVDEQEINKILEISKQSKAMSRTDFQEASKFLIEALQELPCFGLFIDRKRGHRPYRIGFLGYEWLINEVLVRIEGEEPHNGSSLMRLDEIDCAVVGLDELLTMTQYYLRNPTLVTKWGMYNYNIDKPTGIRIAGSAQLTRYNKVLGREVQDMVGFFLIAKSKNQPKPKHTNDFLTHLSICGNRVFVKGRYVEIVQTAYPDLKIVSVEDVEDAVMQAESGSVGLEIVQTGNTLKRKGLVLYGAPLFLSESLYVVNYNRYLKNESLQKFVHDLNPVGYFEDQHIQQFVLWYLALEKNLGDSWINKPSITELFCDPQDPNNGLRPYRLQTRYWQPDDFYKQNEAITLIEEAKVKLQHYYQEYSCGS